MMPLPGTRANQPVHSGDMLKEAIQHVTAAEEGSEAELHNFLNNEGDLHSATISTREAELSVQVMLEVPNKLSRHTRR
jgi:flagellar hook-basal body complex protein FliE